MTNCKSRAGLFIVALAFAVACTSCGRFGKDGGAPPASSEAMVSEAASPADREASLKKLVEDYVAAASRSEGSSQILRKKPYWFKEYSVYPGGTQGMEIEMQESDSRTSPVSAKVTLGKQRFATKLHRKRDEAVADANFLRDTGTETLSFKMRGDRWWRDGSLFVAEKTEENVNGEWVPAQEEVERTVAAEEEKEGNWFNRAWSTISGR
ncbi:MAG: hypothetical protein IT365_23675 [Candidatus Hydrogenedentes bacterium]|nr:hypothetical protein [Candidatus Hydrogenedentota bacterium]